MSVEDAGTLNVEDEILPFEMGYLPDFYIKKAELELNETTTAKTQGLQQMRKMIKDDKHLREIESDFQDDFLVQYLRLKKYNVKKAFHTFKNFIDIRRNFPHSFSNYNFDIVAKTMTDRAFYILPQRSFDGCTIFVVEFDKWDPDVIPVEELKKSAAVFLFQCLRDPMTQVNGFRTIVDAKCSNPLKMLRQITPQNVYQMYHVLQNCFPGRYTGLHIVNMSVVYYAFWVLMKVFLSSKFKRRIHLHSCMDELQNFFLRSSLPVAFGGDLKDCDMTDWLRRAMQPEELKRFLIEPIYQN